MSIHACINEIFSSPQGEGLHTGEQMTFVRFANCSLGCKWCDTDLGPNKVCHVYTGSDQVATFTLENPIGLTKLNEVMEKFNDKTVAITGGEPLEQADFLMHFLPQLSQKRKILLETNGIYYKALKMILDHINIISMDIKLPSSTGKGPFWDEHRQFLQTALESGKELYIKLVVTSVTTDKDIGDAIKLISGANRYIPTFIQPVTPNENFREAISNERILSLKRLFSAWLPNVAISRQMHKIWDVK